MRKRLEGLGHDRKIELASKIEYVTVKIIREKAHLHTSSTNTHQPPTHISRYLMIGARKNGVIDVEQYVRKALADNVPFNIDCTLSRKIAVRLDKRHRYLNKAYE